MSSILGLITAIFGCFLWLFSLFFFSRRKEENRRENEERIRLHEKISTDLLQTKEENSYLTDDDIRQRLRKRKRLRKSKGKSKG